MKFNILVLHRLDSDTGSRKTSIDHAMCYRQYAPHNNYVYYDIGYPVTDALRQFRFHAVILDTTALCIRYYRPRDLFYKEKERWSFLSDIDAVKIAFPQDEYDHSNVLDEWLDDYKFDVVYSVVWDHRELLYPRMIKRGEILPALTGYVNDEDIARIGSFAKPFSERTRDIGYRARNLPPQYGSYGQKKAIIAERVAHAASSRGLVVDVSTRPEDVFLGDYWLKFLGDCKFCLGSESGVSIWDPDGTIRDKVEAFVKDQPDASFEAIEAACFPGLDRRHMFTAMSPRLFEMAMMGCGQILLEGSYLSILYPWKHYIPLSQSMDNLDEVFEAMKDQHAVARMIENCYSALIETPRFRYRHHVVEVMAKLATHVSQKHSQGSPQQEFDRLVERHLTMRINALESQIEALKARVVTLEKTGPWNTFKRIARYMIKK